MKNRFKGMDLLIDQSREKLEQFNANRFFADPYNQAIKLRRKTMHIAKRTNQSTKTLRWLELMKNDIKLL